MLLWRGCRTNYHFFVRSFGALSISLDILASGIFDVFLFQFNTIYRRYFMTL